MKRIFNNNKLFSNTFSLYLLTLAKILFPLISLPYLTRVLSTDCYGVVSYVKSYIVYAQLIVDFGFILSSVKDILKANDNVETIGHITGDTFLAKTILGLLALLVTIVVSFCLPILKNYFWFTLLSFLVVFLSCYLADFLFRGLEKMHYIAITFVVMKGISTALTFVFVHGDSEIMWIPILDIASSLIAVFITFLIIIFKLKIKIRITSLKSAFIKIKESFFYFVSNMATTAFGALNTLLIGIFIADLTQVAFWSVCGTIVAAIQSLYTPITNGIYPYMVKNKELRLIHKTMCIVLPILFVGATIGFVFSKTVLLIVAGDKYVGAFWLLRLLIPLMIISFPSMLYGWPTLGCVEKVKETTLTTLIAAIVQIAGLFLLVLINRFTLVNLAILRTVTEIILFASRAFLTYKYRKLFNNKTEEAV